MNSVSDLKPNVDLAVNVFIHSIRFFTDRDDVHAMIADSKKALEIEEDDLIARSNLALGLLLTGQFEAARAKYETVRSSKNAKAIQDAITDFETALQKNPDIPEASAILDRLRSALPPT